MSTRVAQTDKNALIIMSRVIAVLEAFFADGASRVLLAGAALEGRLAA